MNSSFLIRCFIVAEFFGALVSFSWWAGACQSKYGKECNDAETVYNDYLALWKLQVSVLLGFLSFTKPTWWRTTTTKSNDGDDDTTPLLPPLSLHWVVTMIALANFCGTIMFGSFLVQGLMPTLIHFVSMMYGFGAFAVLFYTAIVRSSGSDTNTNSSGASSSDMMTRRNNKNPGTTSTSSDAPLPKSTQTYLMVVAGYYLLWVFLNSDGSVCTEVILKEEDFTPLAVAQWNFWSIATLENALIFVWAAMLDSNSDSTQNKNNSVVVECRILVCQAVALMQIPSLLVVYYLLPITTLDIQMKTTTSFVLMFLFAIWCVKKDMAALKKGKLE